MRARMDATTKVCTRQAQRSKEAVYPDLHTVNPVPRLVSSKFQSRDATQTARQPTPWYSSTAGRIATGYPEVQALCEEALL